MSFSGVFSTLGRLSGRRRNTIANSSGREPRIEGGLVQERPPPSTRASRRKRSKSVTFSPVDLVWDVTTTTMDQPPPSSHGNRPHSRSRRNTVASPRSSVPMSHSHPWHSEAPRILSHKPRWHTVSASPIADASCIKQPKEYLHSRRDKRSSDAGRLATSANHNPTFVYVSDREQDADTACAPFIEDASKPHHFSPLSEQRFGFSPSCYFPPHLFHPGKHNYIVRLLSSELTPSFSSDTHPESVVLLDAGVNQALPPVFRSPLPFRDRNILIEKAHNKGLGMFAQRKLRTGKLILAEHPVLVTPYVVAPGTSVSGIYQQMFDLLSKHLRRELLDLAVSAFQGGEYVDEKNVYESIVRINTLAISLPVPHLGLADHRAIFLKLGRCNHRFVKYI